MIKTPQNVRSRSSYHHFQYLIARENCHLNSFAFHFCDSAQQCVSRCGVAALCRYVDTVNNFTLKLWEWDGLSFCVFLTDVVERTHWEAWWKSSRRRERFGDEGEDSRCDKHHEECKREVWCPHFNSRRSEMRCSEIQWREEWWDTCTSAWCCQRIEKVESNRERRCRIFTRMYETEHDETTRAARTEQTADSCWIQFITVDNRYWSRYFKMTDVLLHYTIMEDSFSGCPMTWIFGPTKRFYSHLWKWISNRKKISSIKSYFS